MQHVPRKISALIGVLSLLTTCLLAAAGPASAVAAGCRTVSKTWGAYGYEIGKVANLQLTVRYCWGTGGWVNQVPYYNIDYSNTNLMGQVANYQWRDNGPFMSPSTLPQQHVKDVILSQGRQCPARVGGLCGNWEDFTVQVDVYGPSAIGNTVGGVGFSTPWCTDTDCRVDLGLGSGWPSA